MCWLRYLSFIHSVNEACVSSYVGHPKITTYSHGRVNGEDPAQRAYIAVRAWLAVAAPWWLQHRGVNIALQTDAEVVQRTSQYTQTRTNPCHLFFAILDAPPPPAEGQPLSHPPVFQTEGTAPPPSAETMEAATMVQVQAQAASIE